MMDSSARMVVELVLGLVVDMELDLAGRMAMVGAQVAKLKYFN
jgi:hypothetical protein